MPDRIRKSPIWNDEHLYYRESELWGSVGLGVGFCIILPMLLMGVGWLWVAPGFNLFHLGATVIAGVLGYVVRSPKMAHIFIILVVLSVPIGFVTCPLIWGGGKWIPLIVRNDPEKMKKIQQEEAERFNRDLFNH